MSVNSFHVRESSTPGIVYVLLVELNCLMTGDFTQALQRYQLNKTLSKVDQYLLFTCWESIFPPKELSHQARTSTNFTENSKRVLSEILQSLILILQSGMKMSLPSLNYLLNRSIQILEIRTLPESNKHLFNLITNLKTTLQQPSSMQTIPILLRSLLILTYQTDILPDIRQQNLIPIILPLTSKQTDNNNIRQLALAIIAQIMNENDPLVQNQQDIIDEFINQLDSLQQTSSQDKASLALTSIRGNTFIQHVSRVLCLLF